jgi:hypothetical protein
MKFTLAWFEVLFQNSVLKILLVLLSFLCLLLGGGIISLSEKDPLIIERACFSSILASRETTHTNGEVKAFVTEALFQRYDSSFDSLPIFLSPEEKMKAQKDREEMAGKKIRTRLLINNISVTDQQITVDADRIISVDTVRTAFRFLLEAKIATVARSERNPYGLMLVSVSEVQVQGK